MSCDWEGNCRSGIALTMRHRLKWFIHLRAQGLNKGDLTSTSPTLLVGYGTLYLYTQVTSSSHSHDMFIDGPE